jgi:hypothetical protein
MTLLYQKYDIDYKTFRDMNPHILSDAVPKGTFLNVP